MPNPRAFHLAPLGALTLLTASACAALGAAEAAPVAPATTAPATAVATAPATSAAALPTFQPLAPEAIGKDRARWALPTDAINPDSLGSLKIHAETTIDDDCMAKAGFPEFTPTWDAFAPAPAFYSPSGRPVFNPESAKLYGYRNAPDPRNQRTEADYQALDSLPKAYQEALSECTSGGIEVPGVGEEEKQRDAEIMENLDNPEKLAALLENQTPTIHSQLNRLQVDASTPELTAAAAAWRECMSPLGIADLPARPWVFMNPGEAPESLMNQWEWRPTGQASADEIRVASHDAQCRESSGWSERFYDAEWKLHSEFIANNKAEIENILEENKLKAEYYLAAIEQRTRSPQVP
ncbi:hypothetical protein [Buchananella hordeovulneris]|uniref:hypothetical protein n=1 Tax=Buchananella hordeovulneris TaxID=52770 RepID=UPI000F5FD5F4|nr:hypothetical protein [Buchananella hordeovulneris]MDO5080445.1 hypothetical protein [Buchananella hordeovulneris]RRD44328.1 hypothetical protein EII13_04310 [Buchananella hordeovulneris]